MAKEEANPAGGNEFDQELDAMMGVLEGASALTRHIPDGADTRHFALLVMEIRESLGAIQKDGWSSERGDRVSRALSQLKLFLITGEAEREVASNADEA